MCLGCDLSMQERNLKVIHLPVNVIKDIIILNAWCIIPLLRVRKKHGYNPSFQEDSYFIPQAQLSSYEIIRKGLMYVLFCTKNYIREDLRFKITSVDLYWEIKLWKIFFVLIVLFFPLNILCVLLAAHFSKISNKIFSYNEF